MTVRFFEIDIFFDAALKNEFLESEPSFWRSKSWDNARRLANTAISELKMTVLEVEKLR